MKTINKCPKTRTGKHSFVYQEKYNRGVSTGSSWVEDKDKPKKCEYCEIIDL